MEIVAYSEINDNTKEFYGLMWENGMKINCETGGKVWEQCASWSHQQRSTLHGYSHHKHLAPSSNYNVTSSTVCMKSQ